MLFSLSGILSPQPRQGLLQANPNSSNHRKVLWWRTVPCCCLLTSLFPLCPVRSQLRGGRLRTTTMTMMNLWLACAAALSSRCAGLCPPHRPPHLLGPVQPRRLLRLLSKCLGQLGTRLPRLPRLFVLPLVGRCLLLPVRFLLPVRLLRPRRVYLLRRPLRSSRLLLVLRQWRPLHRCVLLPDLDLFSFRTVLVNLWTQPHRDVNDWDNSWAWIVPFGRYSGGDFCVTELRRRIPFPAGAVIGLRGGKLEHWTTRWSGDCRFSLVHVFHEYIHRWKWSAKQLG